MWYQRFYQELKRLMQRLWVDLFDIIKAVSCGGWMVIASILLGSDLLPCEAPAFSSEKNLQVQCCGWSFLIWKPYNISKFKQFLNTQFQRLLIIYYLPKGICLFLGNFHFIDKKKSLIMYITVYSFNKFFFILNFSFLMCLNQAHILLTWKI